MRIQKHHKAQNNFTILTIVFTLYSSFLFIYTFLSLNNISEYEYKNELSFFKVEMIDVMDSESFYYDSIDEIYSKPFTDIKNAKINRTVPVAIYYSNDIMLIDFSKSNKEVFIQLTNDIIERVNQINTLSNFSITDILRNDLPQWHELFSDNRYYKDIIELFTAAKDIYNESLNIDNVEESWTVKKGAMALLALKKKISTRL